MPDARLRAGEVVREARCFGMERRDAEAREHRAHQHQRQRRRKADERRAGGCDDQRRRNHPGGRAACRRGSRRQAAPPSPADLRLGPASRRPPSSDGAGMTSSGIIAGSTPWLRSFIMWAAVSRRSPGRSAASDIRMDRRSGGDGGHILSLPCRRPYVQYIISLEFDKINASMEFRQLRSAVTVGPAAELYRRRGGVSRSRSPHSRSRSRHSNASSGSGCSSARTGAWP